MARVSVESQVHRDERYVNLGQLIGGNSLAAIGAMTRIWSDLTEKWTPERGEAAYTLKPDAIARLFEGFRWAKKFADSMVQAELGERLADGAIRIRGSKGRIEWLWKQRNGAKKGGEIRAASTTRNAGRFSPADHQPRAGCDVVGNPPAATSPPTTTLTSSPSSLRSEENISLATLALAEAGASSSSRVRARFAYSESFETTWPRISKGNKRQAFTEWETLRKAGELPDSQALIESWELQVSALDAPSYQLDTCRWLKRRGWEDAPRNSNGNGSPALLTDNAWDNPI